MFDRMQDARIRAAAFEWLSGQVSIHGDVLQRTILSQGFILDGDRDRGGGVTCVSINSAR
jgi:hypothetical protein